ncbi:spermidine/putrescine ABC transporter permease [Dictyobacter alpinus]|uniref:Spermidine/putrescine ABC transporter permease n=1 Tax=Dictyobacter alpinus TaxID=2014873 RepID=A0A402B1E3_9CHLR|nr:sugar ABC transporter permease [Dictyobacter alpinus]GCE25158.1 spermidine/putrescine ABC transporter permease [Dictyobacter alpinus]
MALLTVQRDRGRTTVHPQSRRRPGWKRYRNRTFYFFIAPWLLGFLLLTVIPFAFALIVSFTSFDGFSAWRWIGFKNYIDLVHDTNTLYSLGRTLLFVVITIPITIIGGLGLAVLVDRKLPGINLFRSAFYLPSVMPIVAAAIVWRSIFSRDTGLINAFLSIFQGPLINWLVDPTAFWAVIVMWLWGMGGGMLTALAGLKGISPELKEASRIDGANAWQSFRHVTLPLLTPIIFFQVITSFIGTIQILMQPLLLAATNLNAVGYIPRGNYFYMVHVYAQFFYFQRFGYGAALLWVLFLVILLITLIVFRSGVGWVYYEVER